MTNEEALSRLEDRFCYSCHKYEYNPSSGTNELYCSKCEYHVTKKALEKQIPRKPDEYYDGYSGGYPVIEYTCPNCGEEVDDTDHHCVCGQTLNWDWSDEDEEN